MEKENLWSLEELYTGIESKEYIEDVKNLENSIKDIIAFTKKKFTSTDDSVDKLKNYIEKVSYIHKKSQVMEYLFLALATDTTNEKLTKELNKVEQIYSKLTSAQVNFKKFLLGLENLESDIGKSKTLKEYEFFLLDSKKMAKYDLSEKEEVVISTMKITGSSAWEQLRGDFISTMKIEVEIDGKKEELPFPAVRNLAFSKDKNLRKKAFEAELLAYKKIEKPIANAINCVKGEALAVNDLKGISLLENTLLKSRMSETTLDVMIDAMKDSMPKLRKYFKHKSKMLGYENGLPFYELFAPVGGKQSTYTYDEALSIIVKSLSGFHSSIGDYLNKAIDNNWIDPLPKEGKRDGAFCANIQSIGESRILSNFSGSYSCMGTLAHELGHGYHGECLREEKILNSDYPMPIAETASIFFETLLMDKVLENIEEEEKTFILDNSLTDATQVIIDIYSRFIFEKNMIEARKKGTLSVDELNVLMVDAQKEAYGDGLSSYHPYMWLVKPHYYSADLNFYNFPYAFGLLFSKGIYAYSKKINNNDEFIKIYKKLLSITGKNNLEDIGLEVGIDINKKEFWTNSLKVIENDVDEFLKL